MKEDVNKDLSNSREEPSSGQPPQLSPHRYQRILFFGSLWLIVAYMIGLLIDVYEGVPPLKEIEAPKSITSSKIYTDDLVLLGRIHRGENRELLDLSQVSPHVVNALIATEDRRFFDHSGIDAKALWASAFRFITRGRTTGGSTLSMQLARNLYPEIGRERSLSRKATEMVTALLLERNYTKAEILITYLNTVNIYGNCFGIETAAQRLFGKSALDLSLEEAALIVGLLKGQGRYDPYRKPDLSLARRNLVLSLMRSQEMIPREQADSLVAMPIVVLDEVENNEPTLAPYFRERVRLWMEDWAEAHNYDVYTDGLEIYTSLDSRIQRHAEQAVSGYMARLQGVFDKHIRGREAWQADESMLWRLMRQSYRYQRGINQGKSSVEIRKEFDQALPMKIFTWQGELDTLMSPWDSLKHYSRFLETGLVSIEPSSGMVKAWVGGINYDHFKYDHVEFSKRQTGSTFKPFVYAAAIDNGVDPCERLLNQRLTIDYSEEELGWSPKNVGNSLGGYVTLRQALRYSYNIITARLTKRIGPSTIADYARSIGIQSEVPAYPSICLGTTELNVLEMTGAYATFANQGTWREPTFVKEIRDKNGKVLFQADPTMRNALSPKIAYTMVELLKAVVVNQRAILDHQGKKVVTGGKTGTTQDHSDGWFMGITPDLATGVWVGCAERKMRFRTVTYGQGAYMAQPICRRFFERVYQDTASDISRSKFIRPGDFEGFHNCWTPQNPESYELKGDEAPLPRGFKGWE